MSDEKYNGWTNRETWAVALHINNDQGWQESVHESLREAGLAQSFEDYESDQPDAYGIPDELDRDEYAAAVRVKAGDVIRENVEEVLFGDLETPWAQRLNVVRDIGSLWRVNWDELGASFLEDIADIDRNS